MAVLPLLVAHLLGLLLFLLPTGAELLVRQELYVKPTEDTSCPEPCRTLDKYIQNATQYFVSNTTFNFLPGTHNLSQPLDITGLSNLTLLGSSDMVTIDCQFSPEPFTSCTALNQSTFSFTEVVGLTLSALTLSNCNTIVLSNVANLRLTSISVVTPGQPVLCASNVLGLSDVAGLSLPGASSFTVFIDYTDPAAQVFPLLLHNQLTLRDASFSTPTVVRVSFSQSMYNAGFQCDNFHFASVEQRITINSQASSYFGIMNSYFSMIHMVVRDQIASNSSIHLDNCHLLHDGNGVTSSRSSVFDFHLLSTEAIIEDSTFQFSSIFHLRPSPHFFSIVIAGSLDANVLLENVTFSGIVVNGLTTFVNQEMASVFRVQNARSLAFSGCRFLSNEATLPAYRGMMSTGRAIVSLMDSEGPTFTNCTFSGNKGTAIVGLNSAFVLTGSNVFRNNSAYLGGALALYGSSYVNFSIASSTVFQDNFAEDVGGAIYVQHANNNPNPGIMLNCALQLEFVEGNCRNQYILFANNTAFNGGSAIYGTSFDTCLSECNGSNLANALQFIPASGSNLSTVSSDPLRVCLCNDSAPSCSTVFSNLTRFPGEDLQIQAVVVGDTFGTVSGSVYAQLLPLGSDGTELASLGAIQDSQQVGHHQCTNLTYTVYTNSSSTCIALSAIPVTVSQYPDENAVEFINTEIDIYLDSGTIPPGLRTVPVFINITMSPCPLGFMLSSEELRCVCDDALQAHSIDCNLTTQTVKHSGTVWVNASFHNGKSNGVILTEYCPNNYCRKETVNVNLMYPDAQCALSHSGTLCGRCQSGLSLALGGDQCLCCSQSYLALLIPFLLAGIVLVFFLKVLNLTVADGTLNGFIFYANILKANRVSLFPDTTSQNILTIFIAWLNLDLGIETCFIDGLDAYWKTWLQFVFPIYIIAIMILIIVLSRCFSRVARILGNNSVPVLATLYLIAHTKLFGIIITILQFSTLEHPHGETTTVWSYDGNITYLSPKHIPLFMIAVILLLFCIPYTGVLLFGQCIQKSRSYRVGRLYARVKPFFDAYFGPFKDQHRYWVGLLLLVRGVLYTVYAATPTSMATVNVLATGAIVLGLLVYPYVCWVYKKMYLNLLESSFLLNLGLLSLGTIYVQASGGSQAALTYTSIGICFVQFVAVVTIRVFTVLYRYHGKWTSVKHRVETSPTRVSVNDALEVTSVTEDSNSGFMRFQVSFSKYREPVLKYLDTY